MASGRGLLAHTRALCYCGPAMPPSRIFATLLGLVLVSAPLRAADSYQVQIQLTYQDTKKFEFVQVVDRATGAKIEFDATRNMEPLILEAKKKLALKLGYHPRIYGEEFWKILVVNRIGYTVEEKPGGRVVARR